MKEFQYHPDGAFYVLDIAEAKRQTARLREKLPQGAQLCYAVKANTFLIPELTKQVDRFEVCSPGEAEICRRTGVADNMLVISGVYKTPAVIEDMVSSCGERIYTVESASQFSLLRRLSEKYQKKLPILLRLTNGSQFGITEYEIRQIISQKDDFPYLHFLGIQFFSGTQKTSLKKIKRELEALDALLLSLKKEYGYEAGELEYGPGFPVAYFAGENPDTDNHLAGFFDLLAQMTAKPRITLELGRAIAASCGRYYTHVVDKKRSHNQNYLLVDGGMHHLVYFGQYMAMKQPFLSVPGKKSQPCTENWNICGSLCSMNDILAKQMPLPDMQIGDTLCFENAGAYCLTEGAALFLSRELPPVYLKKENGTAVCVRDSFETYTLNMQKTERQE